MTPSGLSAIRVECATIIGVVECNQWDHIFHGNMAKRNTCGHENCVPIGFTPNYPEDANAALSLAAALADEGWRFAVNYDPGASVIQWEIAFVSRKLARTEYATAPTFAIALCLAFLKVHRSKKD